MTALSARETILKLFRNTAGGFVSSSQISAELGVSRNAVWKQIEGLRELGYRIEAIPSRGYQLIESPDVLLPEELQVNLNTIRIGREILYFTTTDSTNIQASAHGEAGAEEGLVVIADHQSSGKGRLGRHWSSPAGVNLYASILLRPKVLPWEAPQLTFLSAVSVCRAIEEVTGLKPGVKWPNDVTLNERKVAGLLNEMNSETDRVNFVVLGVGVNLNMGVEQFPKDLRYPATSLMIEKGQPVSRVAFAKIFLKQLDQLYTEYLTEGIAPVQMAWTKLCNWVGRRVIVECQAKTTVGIVQGLDEDGALLIVTEAGHVEKILAGDVQLAPPSLK